SRIQRPLHDCVGNLVDSVLTDDRTAFPADGYPDARKEQPEVIIDLSRGSDGRARRSSRVPLTDRNRGRDAVNFVNIWLFDTFQKLACVSGKRFDVSALPFRVNRVECER